MDVVVHIFRPQWGGLRQCIMGNSKVKAAP